MYWIEEERRELARRLEELQTRIEDRVLQRLAGHSAAGQRVSVISCGQHYVDGIQILGWMLHNKSFHLSRRISHIAT